MATFHLSYPFHVQIILNEGKKKREKNRTSRQIGLQAARPAENPMSKYALRTMVRVVPLLTGHVLMKYRNPPNEEHPLTTQSRRFSPSIAVHMFL